MFYIIIKVVDPYKDYPELLDILLKLLKTEMSLSMHRLTIKVLGIIGALDPYAYKVYLGRVHSTQSKSLALSLPNSPNELHGFESGCLFDFLCFFNFASERNGANIIQWIGFER